MSLIELEGAIAWFFVVVFAAFLIDLWFRHK